MIVSITHSTLKNLFEKGTAAGLPKELKDYLLLWLSVIHAAKNVNDLSISDVSILEGDKSGWRLIVQGVGTFTFRFIDGEVRQLNYRQEQK